MSKWEDEAGALQVMVECGYMFISKATVQAAFTLGSRQLVPYTCEFVAQSDYVPADKHCKLDAKAIEVTFIGYEPGSKGYRLWDTYTHSIHLSQDVTFDKSSFPYLSGED